MACTSFDHKTGLWLTTFGSDAKQGDTPCISCSHPIRGGEFTTYRLPAPVGTSEWGEPQFILGDAEIEFEGKFYSYADLLALRDAEFERTAYYTFRRKQSQAA